MIRLLLLSSALTLAPLSAMSQTTQAQAFPADGAPDTAAAPFVTSSTGTVPIETAPAPAETRVSMPIVAGSRPASSAYRCNVAKADRACSPGG